MAFVVCVTAEGSMPQVFAPPHLFPMPLTAGVLPALAPLVDVTVEDWDWTMNVRRKF